MQRYPLSAATIASPVPVLPEVGSTIVPPGFSFPSRSAASTMVIAIRSLIEPPGLRNSSLASTVAAPSGTTCCRRTSGVLPTSSSSVGYSRGITPSVTRGPLGSGGLGFRRRLGRARPAQEHEGEDSAQDREGDQTPEGVLEAVGGRVRQGVPAVEQVVPRGREDRRGNRDADGAADLLVRVDQARRETRLRRRDLGERCDRDRDEREREAESEGDVGRQQ